MIHPSAVISPNATLHESVEVGPFCMIGDNVSIDANCVLHSHVAISGHTTIGESCEFFPFSSIGQKTQDLKYAGEPTSLVIGNRNVFRENCTVHRSTDQSAPTTIGNDNLFLCYSHVAHDCQLGNHIIMSNEAGIAGHVIVEDYAIISAKAGVHQFVRIGAHCLVGGLAKAVQDVAPFTIMDGGVIRGLNAVGLQRRGFSAEDLSALKKAYKKLFLKKDTNFSEALKELKGEPCAENPHVAQLIAFAESTERGLVR